MELREFGALLREEREKRGLSLEDIARQTRIGLTSLQGIEEGREDLLPHAVYAKGFIKVYAKFLGLDLGEALSELKLGQEDESGPPVYKPVFPDRSAERSWAGALRKGNGLIVAASVLLLVVVGVVYWFYSRPGPELAHEQAAPAPVAAKEPLAAAEPEPSFSEVTSMEPEPAGLAEPAMPGAATASAEPAQPASIVASDTREQSRQQPAQNQLAQSAQPTLPASAPSALPAQPQATAQAQPVATNTAVISAKEVCWVKATHEDGREREYMLQPGGSVRLNFSTVSVIFGNAGGVDITLNGQPYPFEAEPGQVRRVRLP